MLGNLQTVIDYITAVIICGSSIKHADNVWMSFANAGLGCPEFVGHDLVELSAMLASLLRHIRTTTSYRVLTRQARKTDTTVLPNPKDITLHNPMCL